MAKNKKSNKHKRKGNSTKKKKQEVLNQNTKNTTSDDLVQFNAIVTNTIRKKNESFSEVSNEDNKLIIEDSVTFNLEQRNKAAHNLVAVMMKSQNKGNQFVCKQVDWSGAMFLRTVEEIKDAICCTNLRPVLVHEGNVLEYTTKECKIENEVYGQSSITLPVLYEGESKKKTSIIKVNTFSRDKNGLITIWSPILKKWQYPYYLSGPLNGGSRDTSALFPKTIFTPFRSDEVRGKYGLDMSENWTVYGGNIGDDLNLLACKVRPVTGEAREASSDPDVYDCACVAILQDMSVMVPSTPDRVCKQKVTIPFVGHKPEFIERAIQLQTSYWTMFHAEFFYFVNKLAQDAKILYPEELGFVHMVDEEGFTKMCDADDYINNRNAKDKHLCSQVRKLSQILKHLVDLGTHGMVSLNRPGFMAHYFYSSYLTMAEFLQGGKYLL